MASVSRRRAASTQALTLQFDRHASVPEWAEVRLAPAVRRQRRTGRMGALNDVFVARARYQALASLDPAAWFALGSRIAEPRALAKPELARLATSDPPAP